MNVATPVLPTDWLEEPSTVTVYPDGMSEPDVVTVTASVARSGRPSSARGLGLWESLQATVPIRVAPAIANKVQLFVRAIVVAPYRSCRHYAFQLAWGQKPDRSVVWWKQCARGVPVQRSGAARCGASAPWPVRSSALARCCARAVVECRVSRVARRASQPSDAARSLTSRQLSVEQDATRATARAVWRDRVCDARS